MDLQGVLYLGRLLVMLFLYYNIAILVIGLQHVSKHFHIFMHVFIYEPARLRTEVISPK